MVDNNDEKRSDRPQLFPIQSLPGYSAALRAGWTTGRRQLPTRLVQQMLRRKIPDWRLPLTDFIENLWESFSSHWLKSKSLDTFFPFLALISAFAHRWRGYDYSIQFFLPPFTTALVNPLKFLDVALAVASNYDQGHLELLEPLNRQSCTFNYSHVLFLYCN